jgi:galactokinase
VIVARAPGRVNLIGEHTDYNEGFVMPIAIDRGTTVTAIPRGDRTVTVESRELGESDRFSLDRIEATGSWRDYVRGVVGALSLGHGVDLRIESDLPRGAGLSSSAALEIAVARALSDEPAVELALLARRVENEFVGVQCGIMDQLTVAIAKANHALVLDCRDLTTRYVPIPDEVAIVVCDSRLERRLASSGYNERRAECEEAARLIGVDSLRDASLRQIEDLPCPLRRRARHVITENERTIAAAEALLVGDIAALGELMDDSHRSMRDDFEIVPAQLDALAAAVRDIPGCSGARLTGGGFGGATVNLVYPDAFKAVQAKAEALGAVVHVCRAASGVEITGHRSR